MRGFVYRCLGEKLAEKQYKFGKSSLIVISDRCKSYFYCLWRKYCEITRLKMLAIKNVLNKVLNVVLTQRFVCNVFLPINYQILHCQILLPNNKRFNILPSLRLSSRFHNFKFEEIEALVL